jgi:hypothetical protein
LGVFAVRGQSLVLGWLFARPNDPRLRGIGNVEHTQMFVRFNGIGMIARNGDGTKVVLRLI